MSPTIIWLLAGGLFIALEIFGIPGIGFLFAGIAALMVGGAIEFGLLAPEAVLLQGVIFSLISCISAVVLWSRLKAERPPSYSNMVGTEAEVAVGGLIGNKEGQVKWSGTLMRAQLHASAGVDVLPEGARVTIHEVDGNLVYVIPKHA